MSIQWAYGVTTVPSRFDNLLPRTLNSLRNAGFDKPILFADGTSHARAMLLEDQWGLCVCNHNPTPGKVFGLRTYGTWILALAELYIRYPNYDRYAIFQDDLIATGNLRAYLDKCEFPAQGYWNLYTFIDNEKVIKGKSYGWYEAKCLTLGRDYHGKRQQCGRGALGLVFNRRGVVTLLRSQHMIERPLDLHRGWRKVDGGVVESMNKEGYREYIHNPSLLQHTGRYSSMGSKPHKEADSFMGQDFDALKFLLPT